MVKKIFRPFLVSIPGLGTPCPLDRGRALIPLRARAAAFLPKPRRLCATPAVGSILGFATKWSVSYQTLLSQG